MTFAVSLCYTRCLPISSNGVPFPRLQQRRRVQRGLDVIHCQIEKDSENGSKIVEEALTEETEIRPQEEATTPFGVFVNFLTWSFIIVSQMEFVLIDEIGLVVVRWISVLYSFQTVLARHGPSGSIQSTSLETSDYASRITTKFCKTILKFIHLTQ